MARATWKLLLAAVGLAAYVAAHVEPPRARKSLSFGPVYPQARLRIPAAHQQPLTALGTQADLLDVARRFIEGLLPGGEFELREDSYTDAATGVTHVYARQRVRGVEVADGDVNVNVREGVVISYGDLMYHGETFERANGEVDPRSEYCEQLRDRCFQHGARPAQAQVPLATAEDEQTHGVLKHLYESNCDVRNPFLSNSVDPHKVVQNALLRFMLNAAPTAAAADDIAENWDAYLDKMDMKVVNRNPKFDEPMMLLNNVYGAAGLVKAKYVLAQVPQDGSTVLQYAYKFEVEMRDNWYEAYVSANAPHNILSVVDWASDAFPAHQRGANTPSYNVFRLGLNDPSDGERTIESHLPNSVASPAGWHALPKANDPKFKRLRGGDVKGWHNSTATWGNNVFAHEDWEGRNNYIDNFRPHGDADMLFNFTYPLREADAKVYINASVTQLFYTSNMAHDLFYAYGFTERAGNFQQHNFDRGGRENDAVIANAQDGSGYNNANFMTPPDGQNGRCRMYIWNTDIPHRDGDLDNSVIIHELAHGLSNRLTGGPLNVGCLGWGEAGGMGEGWGDFLAATIQSDEKLSNFPLGAWVANRENGIRNYPYSTNRTTNPTVYNYLDKPSYWGVHAIGEVWAQILWLVNKQLVDKHGFSHTLFPSSTTAADTDPTSSFYHPRTFTNGAPDPPVPAHGNTLMFQLVLNGMKLQPCRPSFVDARDAIIQADWVLTRGNNVCEIWRGFALTGMGPKARTEGGSPWGGGIHINDFEVPEECR